MRLQKCKKETEEVLELNKHDVLGRKKNMMLEICMATSCYPETFVPVEKANIVFSKSDTVKVGSHIGKLRGNEFDTLSLSERNRSYLANSPVTNSLTLVSDNNQPLAISPVPITCIAVTPPHAAITSGMECEVKKVEQNYRLSFVPRSRGLHGMYFFVGGLQVWKDPIIFNVIPTPEKRIGTKPMYEMQCSLQGPIDVAVSDDGDLTIAEFGANCVLLYKYDLNKFIIKASSGIMKGQVFNPMGIAFSKTGRILVTDSHRLQLLPSAGSHQVLSVGSETVGSSPTQFNDPVGVAANRSTGDIFVADRNNHRIQVFSASLVYCRTIHRYGLITGILTNPCALTVDEDGYVYVCLQNDLCVYKLSPNGRLKTRIEPKEDELPRRMLNKSHLSVAVCDGFVYVGNHKSIVIFDTSGKYCCRIDNLKSEAVGLDIDVFGDLYVTDAANKTIVVL